MADADVQRAELSKGVVDIHAEEELQRQLERGKPLLVKAGFDPTRPDLHLGHAVLMSKLRQFQEFGHRVVFVVGDFTAQIGDPSGRSATRPVLTRQEIEHGAASYAEQAFKILDRERTELVYNSSWLGTMQFADVLRLAGKYTLARMLERDDFKNRFRQQQSISIHELLYPLAQGYDSVHLNNDVELGGTDQLFNLLVGRHLMREHGQKPQVVMTTPILEGLNAREEGGRIVGDKMSKSLDNYVGITEAPESQFGKLMSVSDAVMWRYYELLSAESLATVQKRQRECESGAMNPRDAKIMLAMELVERFWDRQKAEAARDAFMTQFSGGRAPEKMPEFTIEIERGSEMWLPKVLAEVGLVESTSEGRRRINQGAVRVGGEKVTDKDVSLGEGIHDIRAGKRSWARVHLIGR